MFLLYTCFDHICLKSNYASGDKILLTTNFLADDEINKGYILPNASFRLTLSVDTNVFSYI
jgi:hypothetical protein